MKKLFLKLIFFFAVTGIPFLVYLYVFAGESTDAYYVRFTIEKQQSFILGTSGSAQGIIPSVINQSNLNFEKPVFNFSFSGSISPFGPAYLKAIKSKINENTKNGLFIISVSPYALSSEKKIINSPEEFSENESLLDNLCFYSLNPNYDYLIRYYYHPYYTVFMNYFIAKTHDKYFKNKDYGLLREDGWLDVTVTTDSIPDAKRKEKKYSEYNEAYYNSIALSENRFKSLNETINYLKQFGLVVLIRLPLDKYLFEKENYYFPDFNDKIDNLSKENGIKYFDYTKYSGIYKTIDGIHLRKDYGKVITEELVKDIEAFYKK